MFNRCTLVIYKYTLCVKNTRILGTANNLRNVVETKSLATGCNSFI